MEVRTRSGYYAPDAKAAARAAPAPVETAALAQAIGGLLPAGDLPLRAAVVPVAVPGQRLAAVGVVLGVTQPVPAAAATRRVTEVTELQVSAFTPEGEPRGTQRHTARVTLRAGADGTARYEVFGRIDLPAGRYRLRLAAHNTTSRRTGSVFADVTVPDYARQSCSATPVIVSATPGPAWAPRELLAAVLPVVPTADRTFAAATRVTAFVRLYQDGQRAVQPVLVGAEARDTADHVVWTGAATLPAARFVRAGQALLAAAPGPVAGPPGRYPDPPAPLLKPKADTFANLSLASADYQLDLPLAAWPAGEYLLRVEASCGDTVLTRPVRFAIR